MKKTLNTIALAGAALLLVGCSNNRDPLDVSFDAITDEPSPTMIGTVQRPVDLEANLAVVNDTNLRLIIDDLQRVFYTDHASRLSPMPIPYRNGLSR